MSEYPGDAIRRRIQEADERLSAEIRVFRAEKTPTLCLNCGHDEEHHTFTEPEDGHTEASPCDVLYGRMEICGCINFAAEGHTHEWRSAKAIGYEDDPYCFGCHHFQSDFDHAS